MTHCQHLQLEMAGRPWLFAAAMVLTNNWPACFANLGFLLQSMVVDTNPNPNVRVTGQIEEGRQSRAN